MVSLGAFGRSVVLENTFMKVFLLACACAVVIALVAVPSLNSVQEPVSVAFSSPSGVRL
jgi:hypothetical protein